MAKAPLKTYFRINRENYEGLIDALMAETEELNQQFDGEISEARSIYFETAITKGVDLSNIASAAAPLTASELIEAAGKFPDKEAQGWNGSASLSEKDRKAFDAAAQDRSAKMQWDTIFVEGKNDILLPFSGEAQSFDDRIENFIDGHNLRAKENFEKARELDAQALQADPQVRPIAGRAIDQQLIRRDLNDPSKLQIYRPDAEAWKELDWEPQEENWKQGQKLGKFLQDQYEWELFDIVQRETESRSKKQPQDNVGIAEGRYSALKDFANRSKKNADDFLNSDSLRVVISRDPQKIGEMSTGQRWRSCMAKDGINYHFVPHDIKAGSLVAYVVYKDDVEARYPLMRQMIKPFRNKQGETILVPAKIYGGDGQSNSLTRDALQQMLNNFVATHNAGATGEFHMDSQLYADGQAQVVSLQRDWSPDSIQKALKKYQDGALREWIVELETNKTLLEKGLRGQHGEDPAGTIKKLKKNIQRGFASQDMETGLPRMFFREMLKSSIGSMPRPKDIHSIAANDDELKAKESSYKALAKGDLTQWECISEKFSYIRLQIALAVAVTAEAGSEVERLACVAWCTDWIDSDSMMSSHDLSVILKKNPQLADGVFNSIKKKGSMDDAFALNRERAYTCLGVIFNERPDLVEATLIEYLAKKLVSDKEGYICNAVPDTLHITLKQRPDLIDSSLVAILTKEDSLVTSVMKKLTTDRKIKSRRARQTTLQIIIRERPDLVDSTLISSVTKTAASDRDDYVRTSALETLGVIFEKRSDLADSDVLSSVLKTAVSTRDRYTREEALKTIQIIVEGHPELANVSLVKGLSEIQFFKASGRERSGIINNMIFQNRPDLNQATLYASPLLTIWKESAQNLSALNQKVLNHIPLISRKFKACGFALLLVGSVVLLEDNKAKEAPINNSNPALTATSSPTSEIPAAATIPSTPATFKAKQACKL